MTSALPIDFWNDVLRFAQDLTEQVGSKLLRDSRGLRMAIQKEDGSLVTDSDRWADEYIRKAIATTFPEHGVLSEEAEHRFPTEDWCWVVDPLDGTTNFARGIPIWAISLGLLYRGVPVFGYVSIPPLDQVLYGYWSGTTLLAGMPEGAFFHGERIKPTAADLGPNTFFSFCSRSLPRVQYPFPCKIRALGVASYNLLGVAIGTMQGAVEATPKVWDIAAAWVIVQASGGVWLALKGDAPFPLEPGKDYGEQAFPTLVVSRKELVPVFLGRIPALS
ncbi:inositol monophosphatase family protein [Anthocerotibacter panamensis]|uniref:inositol monophosphatase family protein n=1 Tax=Anthocerotibacter panamensis TaxID=2857077 RepID=UPI001C40427A|nr:inositol monophosphatase family protein [Anthocerotibacter panamensis]